MLITPIMLIMSSSNLCILIDCSRWLVDSKALSYTGDQLIISQWSPWKSNIFHDEAFHRKHACILQQQFHSYRKQRVLYGYCRCRSRVSLHIMRLNTLFWRCQLHTIHPEQLFFLCSFLSSVKCDFHYSCSEYFLCLARNRAFSRTKSRKFQLQWQQIYQLWFHVSENGTFSSHIVESSVKLKGIIELELCVQIQSNRSSSYVMTLELTKE